MKLNPALRTGLIWAGVHQAFALLGLALLWVAPITLILFGTVLLLADYPAFLCGGLVKGTEAFLSDWEPFTVLDKYLPKNQQGLSTSIILVLSLGALQWFLIGYAVGARREARKLSQ